MRHHRHFWPVMVVVATFAVTIASFPAYAAWVQRFHTEEPPAAAEPWQPVVDDGHDHDHADSSTKNDISRSVEAVEALAAVTPLQATTAERAVAQQRAERAPNLVPAAEPPKRATAPQDRYAMAGGCYALQSRTSSGWVRREGEGYRADAANLAAAEPFHFQATDLGRYLLVDTRSRFLGRGLLGLLGLGAQRGPSADTDWTIEASGTGFVITLPAAKTALSVGSAQRLTTGKAEVFDLRLTTGCSAWPEVEVNVTGQPHAGVTPYQEVRGYIDAHTHGMAYEFLGGQVHCGRPWHPYGVTKALVDCPDHALTAGAGAVLENFLKGGLPVAPHDTVGWPTFKDWPAPDSLTHEGTYYKWMERSWRGGQRLLVNLLVENNQLCQIYPLKKNSCKDMDAVRLQAQRMREFERYIDAQWGGPGKGWYRIVTDPFEAREVINSGKMAVVMGIETSAVFGCSIKLGQPTCTKESIDRQLDEVYDLGVRQMELVNKFDNALAGVAGDEGGAAPLINAANFLETGSFWDMRQCATGDGEVSDKVQLTAPQVIPEQDALFGAIAGLYLPIKLPLYASGPHCNERGLSDLGEHTIRGLAQRHMLFDPDHMSVKARQASLDLIEELEYPGVVSSHSWSTPDAYPRIYAAGGFVAPYAGDSEGFVGKWRQHLEWADPRYYFGFGFGADINGLGAQGDPRGADADKPVTYPFTGLGGVTIDRQVSGQRVYDVNVDGVAHWGLYPDWIRDLTNLAGDDLATDMARGTEAYLQMWERASGVKNDACRDSRALGRDTEITGLAKGTSVADVLKQVGQPNSRIGTTFGYCAKDAKGKIVKVTVAFTQAGKLSSTKKG